MTDMTDIIYSKCVSFLFWRIDIVYLVTVVISMYLLDVLFDSPTPVCDSDLCCYGVLKLL